MTDLEQEQVTFVGLMAAAEAVVAVEILSTGYSATTRDGGMARVLKALKGPTHGRAVQFSQVAMDRSSHRSARGVQNSLSE